MPTTATVATPTTEATTVTVDRPLVHANVKREKGQAIMTLDCRGLHAYLATIGVDVSGSGGATESPPGTSDQYFDIRRNKVNARALCRIMNTRDGTDKSILKYNLKDYWTSPLRTEALESILATVNEALVEVLTHYQPVEITLTINPRVAPVATATEAF